MKYNLFLLSSCLFIVGEALDCSNRDSYYVEDKIRKKILCDYDKNIRPEEHVDVTLGFIYKAFEFYDSSSNSISVQSWIILKWNDTRLKWNPSEFEDKEKTYAKFDILWVPDITLMESDVLEDVNSCTPTDCNIYFTGMVECPLPCEHTAYCSEADHTNWPFDFAKCQFTYMSRTQSTKKLILTGNQLQVDSESGALNRAWDLFSLIGYYGNQSSDFIVSSQDPKPEYSFIKMNFGIKRHTPEIIYQVIIPAAIIVALNVILLILDANMSERWILYAIGIFCHNIYIIQLRYMVPSNSDSVPKVLIFFCDSQLITTVLMTESLLMKIYTESEEGQSEWIRQFMNFLKQSWYGQVMVYQETLGTIKNEASTFRFNVSRLIDRILILAMIIIYALMFFTLMPREEQIQNINQYFINYETDY